MIPEPSDQTAEIVAVTTERPSRLPQLEGWTRFVVVFWQGLAGAVLVAAGFVIIFLTWWGVSGTLLLPVQMTYLASGGLAGLACVTLGGLLLVSFQITRQNALLARVLEQAPAPGEVEPSTVVVARGGRTFHRPDCLYATGKPARAFTIEEAEAKGFRGCAVCDPKTQGGPGN